MNRVKVGGTMRRCFFFALLFNLVMLQVDSRGQSQGFSTKLNRLEFENTPLSEVVEFLRLKTAELDPAGKGINFLIDPAVDPEREVSIRLNQVSVGAAMACLVDHAGLDYRVESHACLILAAGKGELAKRMPHPNEVAAQFAPAELARSIQLPQVEFNQAPVKDVLAYLSARSEEAHPETGGLNLVLSNLVDAEMPVSLSLKGVPISSVLYYLTKTAALEIRIEPYAIFVDPPGTRALKEAKLEQERRQLMEQWAAAAKQGRARPEWEGYSLGSVTRDPRSPVHPDYVSSINPDVSKRTNALNNVYKWQGGKWTFVRYGSKDSKSSLDSGSTSLRTSSLQPAR